MIIDKFLQVQELLAESSRWCQGWYALDVNNKNISPLSTDATKWCLLGACAKICDDANFFNKDSRLMLSILKSYVSSIGKKSPVEWNDSITYLELISSLKTIIWIVKHHDK